MEDKPMNKKLIIALLVFLAICAAWFYYEPAPQDTVSKPEVFPTINNAELKEDKDGKRIWELNIATVTMNPHTQVNTLQGVKGRFYRDNGDIINVQSEGGELDLKTKNIKLTGNVSVESTTKEKLTSDELLWNNSDEQVIAIGQAVLTRPDVVAKADKMITDKKFIKSKLLGNASVVKTDN